MNTARMRNVGGFVGAKFLNDTITQFDHGTYVANTSVSATGFMVDRLSRTGASPGTGAQPGTAFPRTPSSGKIVIPLKGTWPSGKTAQTFTVRAKIKYSTASGGTYAYPTDAPTNTVVVGPATATGVKRYVLECPVQLDNQARYAKLHISHNGNSTASGALLDIGAAILVIGGTDQTPATATGNRG